MEDFQNRLSRKVKPPAEPKTKPGLAKMDFQNFHINQLEFQLSLMQVDKELDFLMCNALFDDSDLESLFLRLRSTPA